MNSSFPEVIRWDEQRQRLLLLDQTRLPEEVVVLDCAKVQDVWDAIKRLSVRGAPAIGIAAAYAVCLAIRPVEGVTPPSALAAARAIEAIEHLASSRPTAVNLFWALNRMRAIAVEHASRGDVEGGADDLFETLLAEASEIHREDQELCQSIGRHGADRMRDATCLLTHCNAGSLATGGEGTALAVIYELQRRGREVRVFADETRPLLQGARLTAWELTRSGVPVTVITDSMAAIILQSGQVDAVIVGADRITARGDAANKIGTYALAVLARHHSVPFFVAAPHSTFDRSIQCGDEIPIEQRDSSEIRFAGSRQVVPESASVFNPAFDVTPAELITAIITDRGVIEPPTEAGISFLFENHIGP